MKTSKPLSALSYFPYRKLYSIADQLVEDKVISDYYLVIHDSHHDDSMPHVHILVVPCFPIEPYRLLLYFQNMTSNFRHFYASPDEFYYELGVIENEYT